MNRSLRAALVRVGLAQHSTSPDFGAELIAPAMQQQIKLIESERHRQRYEVTEPESIAFSDGTRVRVRIGKQDDGSYGVKVFNSDGSIAHNLTSSS